MLRFFRYTPSLVLGAIVLACSPPSKEQDSAIEPPVAEKVTKELVANGNTRVDNYYWMKLSDAQKNADEKDEQTKKVIDYLNAENDYLAASLKHIEPLQEKYTMKSSDE